MGKYDRAIGAVAAMLVTILSAPNQAQSQEAETENCRVMPNVDNEESAFREKLADCNGVLKPPITGDSEIREPAPDTGKIRIIRPESQNSGKADSDEEAFIGNRDPDQSFSFLEIVESIAGAAKTAEEQEIRGTAVSVIDLSALTIGPTRR